MPNPQKAQVLDELRQRFGTIQKLKGSESLFTVGDGAALVYFRYSKAHPGGRTFFGLRAEDLRRLEGQNSYLCFLLGEESPPLFIPYADFEEVFHQARPASDGQYKVQLLTQPSSLELYVARQGRFNVEGYVGLEPLEQGVEAEKLRAQTPLSHPQVQTLLGAIGHAKGYEVYIPPGDVSRLEWSLTERFPLQHDLPKRLPRVWNILSEIDVVWMARGRSDIEGLYEVEHSTPIYSGLLRFNDVLLTDPRVSRFSIVSNDRRRELFSQQLARPTFRRSGLSELCSFLEYANVCAWHRRLLGGRIDETT